ALPIVERPAPARDRPAATEIRGLGRPHDRPARGGAGSGRAIAARAIVGGIVGRQRDRSTSPPGARPWDYQRGRHRTRGVGARKQRDLSRAAASTRSSPRPRHRRRAGGGDRSSDSCWYPSHLRGPFGASLLLRRRSSAMRFVEIDLLGVYVAPISLMLVGAWLITLALRRMANRAGVLQHVWHPALLTFATYVIVLSSWILMVARQSAMAVTEITSNRGKAAVDRVADPSPPPEARTPADKAPDDRVADPSPPPEARTPAKRPRR